MKKVVWIGVGGGMEYKMVQLSGWQFYNMHFVNMCYYLAQKFTSINVSKGKEKYTKVHVQEY